MGEAYTPGLQVKEVTVVRKTRRLPILGDVLVKEGDTVTPETIVAKTIIPGDISVIDVASRLGITVGEMENVVRKGIIKVKVGDSVQKDELIAERKYFFNLKQKRCTSPRTGTVDHISTYSGNMHIRGPPLQVILKAYAPGKVVKVLPGEGVVIETIASFIQGIFGIGGETHGELIIVASSPDDVLLENHIEPSIHSGKILVGGSHITGAAMQKAIQAKVKGVIVGAIEDEDLINLLGYEIGVAITGHENINTTLVLTEGFGKIRMSDRTFGLLRKFEGREASISGATQIRAGVIRPEIIIQLKEHGELDESKVAENKLIVGTPVRIIRGQDFGALGHVTNSDIKLEQIETESRIVVIEVRLEDGRQVTVPRTNVEIIEA